MLFLVVILKFFYFLLGLMPVIEKLKSAFKNKYFAPVRKLLLQGSSPKAVAFGIASALVLGLFPVVGTTTILITLFALVFRLNLPMMQLVNYTIFPLQIVIIVPLMKLGEMIFGIEKLSYTAAEITEMIGQDFFTSIQLLGNAIIQAIGAWILIAPFLAIGLFGLLLPAIVKIKHNLKRKHETAQDIS